MFKVTLILHHVVVDTILQLIKEMLCRIIVPSVMFIRYSQFHCVSVTSTGDYETMDVFEYRLTVGSIQTFM